MNGTELLAILSVVIVMVGIPVGIYVYQQYYLGSLVVSDDVQVIRINGWATENGGWQPETIVLEKGKPVRIEIFSADVTHSFYAPELGLDSGPISPGHSVVIEFTPTETGTYTFRCNVYCSPLHPLMTGTIIVVDGASNV
jgi:cytochrome c oxidase subunit 2